jgi:phosphoribosylanthranilate isomerase
MSTFVKICGMTDAAAVRAAVDAGADAVGFVFFAKSPRNVSPAEAAELSAAVPDGIRKVAVTLHPDPDLWAAVQEILRPDVLQTDLGDFAALNVDAGIEKWPVLREGSLPEHLPDTYVYESAKSGSGTAVDWNVAAELAADRRMILAGGLSVANVAQAIDTVRPWGVDVSSAVEATRGVKDPTLVEAFVTAAKAAG